MSNIPLFCVKDVKTGVSDPCTFVNEGLARDSFYRAVPQFLVACSGSRASDFSLLRIGVYDVDSGMISPCMPEFLASGEASPYLVSEEVSADA